ncbi:transporter substrate-binding domain-containing protein [Planotetraspora sp. A-T 1434]|uniref:transporter substrate-binding domain-containing protein n=1 Tax=Planotetraspora sp. A-T 1434 TaxID=2979219 RepID=UPI0021BF6DF5|nr:transporter substrate-binding domain-containing protein [Planotetraspora sp. A-T 1434]MCT9929861.1 transporter substrate-binding domain-containing protein [Planotetraspora sp. A-T 1434]
MRRPSPPPLRSAAGRAVAVMVTAVSLAGCAFGYSGPPPVASPAPSGVRTATAPPSTKPSAACEPRNSLAPDSAPPRSITRKGEQIRAGVDQTLTRMSYRDPATGEYRGFDIDILYEIAKEMFPGRNPRDVLVFVAITSEERQERLRDGTVDIVADSMTATCDRAEEVAFSTDYLDSGQTVLVRGDSGYRGLKDLAGKPVCAATGTTSLEILRNRPEKPVPVGVPNWTDCLVMLQQRQVEAVSTDHNILLGLQDLDPSTRFLEAPPPRSPGDTSCRWYDGPAATCTWFSNEPHAIAFRKDDADFVRFVNHVLQKIRANGRWRAIHDRWLLDHPDKGPPPAAYGPNPTWPPGR